MPRRWISWLVAVAVGGLALGVGPARGVDAPSAVSVPADRETDPVAHGGDAADDPAIWVHPTSPARSLVIGTDKDGALELYDLGGARRQRLTGVHPNNVDLRGDLVGAADDEANGRAGLTRFYRIDPVGRRLDTAGTLDAGIREHGFCMYRSPRTGRTYAFMTASGGRVEQWLVESTTDTVTGRLVRTLIVGGTTEGCVADDATGLLYIGEEDVAVWRYGAEPDDPASERVAVDRAGTGNLVADIEGLAIAGRFLIVSSQGNDTFAVYRTVDNAFVRSVRVVAGRHADGCQGTDGIDAVTTPLGNAFPAGLFVCQDNNNTAPAAGNQNFKLVRLEKLTG